MSIQYTKALICTSVLTAASIGSAHAASFGSLYAFGDSLTDCCFLGPYTNGPDTWVADLAGKIGASHSGTLADSYAVGGAQSGAGNVIVELDTTFGGPTGFLSQVDNFETSGTAINSDDLAIVWIGTNDIHPSANPDLVIPGSTVNRPLGDTPAVADLTNYIVGNIDSGINDLKVAGFENFLILSTFDLALSTPGGATPEAAARSRDYSVALRDALSTYTTSGADTYFLDVLALFDEIQADPNSFGYDPTRTTGFNNCDDAAAAIDPTWVCADLPQTEQDSYVFIDGIHLTTVTNGYVSDRAAEVLTGHPTPAPVPLPLPVVLLGSGVLGLAGLRKLGRRQS